MHLVNKCYLVHENKHNATLDYIYIYTRVADNDRFGERNVTVNDGVKNGLRRFFR